MRRAHRRYRLLLALSAAALLVPAASARAGGCPNEAVRSEQGVQEGAPHSLPVCRAYELVSPPQKNEQEVNYPDRFVREISFQAAVSGGAVQYTLTGAIPGSKSGGLYGAALSRSQAPGKSWEVEPLEPDNSFEGLHSNGEVAGEFERFSPQLDCGVEETRLPLPALNDSERPQLAPGEQEGEGVENLYEWNAPDEYTLVTSIRPTNPSETPEAATYWVDGASADCGTILYNTHSNGYDLPGAPETSLYEWNVGESAASCRSARAGDPSACAPRVASVLPDGAEATDVVDPEAGEGSSDLNQVSSDGSRIFFSAPSDGGTSEESIDRGATQIYLREGGETKKAISLSQAGTPVRDSGAKFEAASSDGERVFFVANYGLTGVDGGSSPKPCITKDINKEKDEDNGAGTNCDLYEYDLASGKLTDISADTADPNGADVRGVLGLAEDGSTVYFSATGQLQGMGHKAEENEATSGETSGNAAKTEAETNVYAYSEGTLHYIATIGEAEAGGWNLGENPFLEVDTVSASKGMHYDQARVSENGEYLMLATRYPLTGYDNVQTETGQREWEEYEYSKATGSLNCVSCDPTGEAPVADANANFSPLGVYIAVQDGAIPRNVANDGRVFFDSLQPLQSSAGGSTFAPANHTLNVFEWRPEGLEGCQPPSPPEGAPPLHGCLGLLDSGAQDERFPTYFEGASSDGRDVYITTHAALAPQDQDGLNDIYDVRIDGGIPAPPPPASCSEDLQSCSSPGGTFSAGSFASEAEVPGGNVSGVVTKVPSPKPRSGTQGVKAYASRKVKGTSVTVSVTAAAPGRITGSGAGFSSTHKSVSKAGVYRLRVTLSSKEKKLLRRRHKLALKLKISFAPRSGRASSASLAITFE